VEEPILILAVGAAAVVEEAVAVAVSVQPTRSA
jgi:hypothetical protein